MLSKSPFPFMIAHRGCSPENKVQGFLNAVVQGARMVECDVQLTKDRQAAVIHDKRVDRITKVKGRVCNMTMKDLALHDIPSITDVLNAMSKDIWIAIEIKPQDSMEQNMMLVDTIMENVKHRPNSIIISFDKGILLEVKNRDPHIHTGFLHGKFKWNNPFDICRSVGANSLWIHHFAIDAHLVANKTVPIVAWTVNDKRRCSYLTSLGVDGIVTDICPSHWNGFVSK